MPCLFESLQCHINADLVAELEAVGHGLGQAVNANRQTIDRVPLYALGIGRTRSRVMRSLG